MIETEKIQNTIDMFQKMIYLNNRASNIEKESSINIDELKIYNKGFRKGIDKSYNLIVDYLTLLKNNETQEINKIHELLKGMEDIQDKVGNILN
jgi:hypothetical protein